MPAIRDSAWNTTTVATGTTLNIPMPSYVVGDLLIAVIVADTGTATWTGGTPPSGAAWAHITGSPTTNTCQLVCMWKYAVASEPTSYTFTASAAESFNGAIISVRDVRSSSPFGVTPVINFVTQAAAAKFNMQQITTNTNNSLVLYASANSAAGVPSLLEGPVYSLVGADGVAESLGIGWGFKATAGLTSASVGVSNIATGAGVKLAFQIVPPDTGATVIPAYCASDSCFYIDPINGTTAFNGNTALAATADTGYATSLGGFTASDATVSAVTDVGINSFHSAGRLTTAAGTNMYGAELVVVAANRTDFTGKNILAHIGPSTEGQLQRVSSIASGRGVWFGMRSGAASNYKVWQVYGVELGSLRQQPIVINSSALNTKATNGTLNPASVLSFAWWIGGLASGTSAWDFVSLWMLDTTVVCGGNAAEPLDLTGIVASAANGKERRSVVKQGSSQAVFYQPVQFGNAGTDPVYLDLDATAIEFPSQYNQATKSVTYNSIDNVAGLTYNAGASDTIIHINSVISSASDYHWRIAATSSPSATYNFSGLSLIGAGDVQLRNVTTFQEMSFTNCTTITQNSAPITNCSFTGSYVLSNAPASISSSSFVSSGTGHAIEITTPGTYSFTGNTFTGYGSTGTTNAAIYNNSGGAVTLNVAGGGSIPTYRNGAGATTTVNASASVTLTDLVAGTEVRAYLGTDPATSTEIAGIESSGTSFSFNQSVAGQDGYIQVFNVAYQPVRLSITYSNSVVSIPIQQITDRNYQP